MDPLFELIKIVLPAAIVFLTAYYLLKTFFANESHKHVVDLKLANQGVITPIRLQAYERVILFLERINPNSIVTRLPKVGNASSFQGELLKTIRTEFEHNVSQQIYMSSKAWEAVVKSKEETIKMVNVAASRIDANATALDLAQALVTVASQLSELPTKAAINLIKKEVGQTF
jgi:hypothetical protein